MSSDEKPPNDLASRRTRALDAYQRGAPAAGQLVAAALAEQPLDGGLLIADATLAQEVGAQGARDRLAQTLMQAPDWLDGHVALTRLRWGAGERDGFLEAIEAALRTLPRHAALWVRYMELLADSGQACRAADVAAELRRNSGDVAALRLIEAQYAGSDGQHDRAGALIETLAFDTPGRAYAQARHRLQTGDPAASIASLDRARAETGGGNSAAWALTEIAWRATHDPRHRWLIDPETMVRAVALDIDVADLTLLSADLRELHARRWPALGQSGRGATQTRGDLRLAPKPSIVRLFERIEGAIAAYVAALPSADADHPLLMHRDAALAVASAWSIRIDGGGHHVSHVHPGGIISSACHITVPEPSEAEDRGGWLELGRPPADIALPLDPLAGFPPLAGQLVLFPSYLYHGTVPFGTGERMSVAFDIA